ncbi:hypothetical protein AB1Y20_017952 [Prymnesium parvum]|uniref:Protein xylosyltransferase n=1 Tax=Prymnesium parvum TaxID=97485 RepID=A0AB34JM28_PRYPA
MLNVEEHAGSEQPDPQPTSPRRPSPLASASQPLTHLRRRISLRPLLCVCGLLLLVMMWRTCFYVIGSLFPETGIVAFAHLYGWTWHPAFSRRSVEASCSVDEVIGAAGRTAGTAPHYDVRAGRRDCQLPYNETRHACRTHDGATPERHPNVTVVTALFDIGRTNRPLCHYLRYMVNLLRMDVNLVVYASPETLIVVERVRAHYGFTNKTDLQAVISWASIPFGPLLPKMYSAVVNSFAGHFSHLFVAGLPEHIIPEYDLINAAKVGFLRGAIERNTFDSQFFFWMDAGAGHGKAKFYDQWCPCTAAIRDKVTLLAGPPEADQPPGVTAEKMTWNVYFSQHFTEHMYCPVGAAWGGDGAAILQFEAVFSKVLHNVLQHNLIDDDQPLLALAYYENSSLFRLMPGHSHSFVNMC